MNNLTRRQFLATATLATGFALAARPISAAVIKTDSKGLETGTAQIPTANGRIPAYWARPASGQTFPIVLVVQEIFGVHEHIQDVCRRFAKLGYLAIAPELFVRQGDVSKLESIDEIFKIVRQVPDAQVMADLDAAVAWAATQKGDRDRLAITGFCWGGRITWLYAAHNPQVKTGAAWYGRLVGDSTALTPKQPVDVAAALKVPVLGFYGGEDTGIPLDTVQQMRDRLKTGQSKSAIIVYEGAPHAFFADYRPSYRQGDAQDAWQRLQTWFKQHGV